jgi:hypothetical protein
MGKARFETELVLGHKGVTVVIVPFDPEQIWDRKPVRLAGTRDGWPVKGTLDGVPFVGYVGNRWRRFFIIIDPEARVAAGVSVGATVSIAVEPTDATTALAKAIEQSRLTTAPGKPRKDAIVPRVPARAGKRGKPAR